jgi:hypothetical protein
MQVDAKELNMQSAKRRQKQGAERSMYFDGNGEARKGEDHPYSKLTETDVILIRAMYHLTGMGPHSKTRLAALFGVHKQTIKSAVMRKTWKHVPEQPI